MPFQYPSLAERIITNSYLSDESFYDGTPCPDGCEVLHLNHNPADNRLENLRYGTRGENLKMDWDDGRRTVHPHFIGARWRA